MYIYYIHAKIIHAQACQEAIPWTYYFACQCGPTKQYQLVQAAHNIGRKVAQHEFIRLDCLSERVYEAFRSFVEVYVSRSRWMQMDFFMCFSIFDFVSILEDLCEWFDCGHWQWNILEGNTEAVCTYSARSVTLVRRCCASQSPFASPIPSMMVYLPTFTIKINQM